MMGCLRARQLLLAKAAGLAFKAHLIEPEFKLARFGAAAEEDGHDVGAVTAVEILDRHAVLLPLLAGRKLFLDRAKPERFREDHDRVFLPVTLRPERNGLLGG